MSAAARIVTVVTPASSYDLTTLGVVKDMLGITVTDSDTFLTRQITQASAAIASFCNRIFASETVRDTVFPWREGYPRVLRGGEDGPLQLGRWPIVSVTSLTENGTALTSGTDYLIDAAKGQILRVDTNGAPRAWTTLPLVITYVAGYATIPADIADAAIRMVKGQFYGRGRDPAERSVSVAGVGDVAYWLGGGPNMGVMTPDVVDLLDNYRVPVIA